MRYAILADIHANLEALEAVLTDIEGWPGARILCAGDIVGYGPDPEACIELVRARVAVCVAGNHEGMVLGRIGFNHCVYAGIRAAVWTRNQISPAARAFIASLPSHAAALPDIIVCHGSLDSAEHYVTSLRRAEEVLAQLEREHRGARILITGHTHRRMLYQRGARQWQQPPAAVPLHLGRPAPWLVNPGAVGQSRDGQPLARYARYDTDTDEVVYCELPYPHQVTVRKMRRAGLVAKVCLEPLGPVARRIEGAQARVARWRAERSARAAAPPQTPVLPSRGEPEEPG